MATASALVWKIKASLTHSQKESISNSYTKLYKGTPYLISQDIGFRGTTLMARLRWVDVVILCWIAASVIAVSLL